MNNEVATGWNPLTTEFTIYDYTMSNNDFVQKLSETFLCSYIFHFEINTKQEVMWEMENAS